MSKQSLAERVREALIAGFAFHSYAGGTAVAIFDRFADEIAAIEAERDRVCDENERLEDQLHKVKMWCRAYPVDVFTPQGSETMKRANDILEAEGISFTAINAHTMRHVVLGMAKIVGLGTMAALLAWVAFSSFVWMIYFAAQLQ